MMARAIKRVTQTMTMRQKSMKLHHFVNAVFRRSINESDNRHKSCHIRDFSVEITASAPNLITGRRRFYKHVGIAKVKDSDHLYRILLDGKELKTPARNLLHLPSIHLAAAIAIEWDAQSDKKGIQPATMPLMTLACTAIDQILISSEATKETCLKYLYTDSALYFTTDEDRILLRKQNEHLRPVIRWFKRNFDIELETCQSMTVKLKHSPQVIEKVSRIVNSLDHFSLACLQSATREFKSIVLALAYFARYISHDEAEIISRIEEEFQVEVWGLVEGGHDMDRLNCSVGVGSVGVFLGLLHDTESLHKIVNDWKTL